MTDDQWRARITQLYDQATALTDAGLFSPSEVLASLREAIAAGELPHD